APSSSLFVADSVAFFIEKAQVEQKHGNHGDPEKRKYAGMVQHIVHIKRNLLGRISVLKPRKIRFL
ncbi:MAG: hypothetical protein ACKVZH_14815, partial [Blastocatellia bacterium]